MRYRASTTEPMGGVEEFIAQTTTGWMVDDEIVQSMSKARKFVETKTFYFHRCICNYCRVIFMANLKVGYECPGCSARDFIIDGEVAVDGLRDD